MAAVASGRRSRQVTVEVCEQRARNVRLRVLLRAELGPCEIVAAVEHPPLGVTRELGGAYERGVRHAISPLGWRLRGCRAEIVERVEIGHRCSRKNGAKF